MFLTEVLFL